MSVDVVMVFYIQTYLCPEPPGQGDGEIAYSLSPCPAVRHPVIMNKTGHKDKDRNETGNAYYREYKSLFIFHYPHLPAHLLLIISPETDILKAASLLVQTFGFKISGHCHFAPAAAVILGRITFRTFLLKPAARTNDIVSKGSLGYPYFLILLNRSKRLSSI